MKYQHLPECQRYEIKSYLQCNKMQKYISEQLGVSESCISRELKHNKLKRGGYSPQKAQELTTFAKIELSSNNEKNLTRN